MSDQIAVEDQPASETPSGDFVPYDLIGGAPTVQKLVDRFYDLMATAPQAVRLRAMHHEDLSPMREKLFQFLSGWLGGPPLYFQRPDSKCMGSTHKPFNITEADRDEWMWCIRTAMEDVGIEPQMRKILGQALFQMADMMRAKN